MSWYDYAVLAWWVWYAIGSILYAQDVEAGRIEEPR